MGNDPGREPVLIYRKSCCAAGAAAGTSPEAGRYGNSTCAHTCRPALVLFGYIDNRCDSVI